MLIHLFIITCFFKASEAQVKSCSKELHPNKICSTSDNSYVQSIPKDVETMLTLSEIVNIDENENSITIQAFLDSAWNDAGLNRSKGSDK